MLKHIPIEIERVLPTVSRQHAGRQDVMEVWPSLQRAFRKAQKYGLGENMDEFDILNRLCDGSLELHIAARGEELLGGLILQFVERPRGKACIVVVSLFNALRDIPRWSPPMNDYLADYAKRACGCYTVEAFARDGAIKALHDLGWRRKATVMEMM